MISLVEFFLFASLVTLTAAGASHAYQLLRRPRGRRCPVSPMPVKDEESNRPSSGVWHEPRRSPRHRMQCRIEYFYGDLCSVGMLVDMSKEGWRATGSKPVPRGTIVSVNIFLPDQPMPVMIDGAIVRWTNRLEFGFELTTIKPEAAARLSDYLAARFPAEQPEAPTALSPFSYN